MFATVLLFLALAAQARADSFLTSVALVRSSDAPLPAPGRCRAELAALVPNVNAFDHAMVIGACHGYDTNRWLEGEVGLTLWVGREARKGAPPWTVAGLEKGANPLWQIDLGLERVYEATYVEGAKARAMAVVGEGNVRDAMVARPADARLWLVAALVLAQKELFVDGGSWDQPNGNSREVVGIVRHAAGLNRAAPTPDFQPSLDAAIDYMVAYGVYAELQTERSLPELPPTTGTGD